MRQMCNKSTSGSHLWNSLGEKLKSKSFSQEKGGRVTGRVPWSKICDTTDWPSLTSWQNTLVPERTQHWITAKQQAIGKHHGQTTVPVNNKCIPFTQDPKVREKIRQQEGAREAIDWASD